VLVLPRLYAILDIDACGRRGLDPLAVLDQWLEAGVRLVQLRAKTLAAGPALAAAESVVRRTRAAGALLICNDRADLARLAGADGVHVGQTDLAPTDVRGLLPTSALVGLSTHNEVQVRRARDEPISYLAIGPVFETASKTQPDPAVGLEGVRMAASLANGVPLVAIGGITVERARSVIDAGATSVAVISDLLQGDAKARARSFIESLG
jgi:thiamine-phosphate pyrophosphorylase